MFTTECDGRQYVFYNDRLTVNGVPIPYREMSNIQHRKGDAPAFIFQYKGRRFALPYHPEDLRSILPYFVHAERSQAAAPAPQPEAPQPEAPQPEAPQSEVPQPEVPQPEVPAPETPVFEEAPDMAQPLVSEFEEPELGEPEGFEPIDPPEDQKKFWSKGKIIAAAIAAVVILVVILFVIKYDAGEGGAPNAEGGKVLATQEDTVEATDGFTTVTDTGAVNSVLKKAYVGDEALKKLAEMGETAEDYEETDEPGYKTVLYEYEITVLDGTLYGDPVTGDSYYSDKKTELLDCWGYILEANEDKDISSGEIKMKAGETKTVYSVYGMPADIKDYYEKVYIDFNDIDRTIWVHYVLE